MFGLYMLAIYLGVAVIVAGFVALLVVVALAVGLSRIPSARSPWYSTSSPPLPPAWR